MCVYSQDAEDDSERSIQMALLRRLCLPMMTFLLLTVLQRTERHQESLHLADIIASDQHRLYEVRVFFVCFFLLLLPSPLPSSRLLALITSLMHTILYFLI